MNYRLSLASSLDASPAKKPATREFILSLLIKRLRKQRTNLYIAFIAAKKRAKRKLSLFLSQEHKFFISLGMFVMDKKLLSINLIIKPSRKVFWKPRMTFSKQAYLCLQTGVRESNHRGINPNLLNVYLTST